MSSAPEPTAWVTDPASIAAFNRGPITSEFSPPSSCTEEMTLAVGSKDTVLFFGHNRINYVDSVYYPPGPLQAQYLGNVESWRQYYYGPAKCPQGYSIATTFEFSLPGGNPSVKLSIGSETAVALCCPSQYSYLRSGHQCASTISRGQTVKYVHPTSAGGNGWQRGAVSTSTYPADSTVRGDGILIMWQESGSAILAAATAISTLASSTAGSTANMNSLTSGLASIGASAPSITGSTKPEKSKGSLPTSAIIGLGVGIPLAVVSGLLLGFLLFRRKRPAKTSSGRTTWKKKAGMAVAPWKSAEHTYEIHEMENSANPHRARSELPGDYGKG